ncbi:MAG: hypothetical protein ABI467_22265 [Kofleriaceae bacterium]
MVRRLALAALLCAACTGSVDGDVEPDAGGADAGVMTPLGDPTAVDRAQQWVDAMVPYCQAANHKADADASCSAICTRPDNAEWDPYRSDCSGLVSWAWELPAPGHTTATLAPYDTSVSHAIDAIDLLPGDAINNDHHTMLFAAWLTPGVQARFLEEPGCSSSQPYAREYIANVTPMGQTVLVQFRGTYTAIRHDP